MPLGMAHLRGNKKVHVQMDLHLLGHAWLASLGGTFLMSSPSRYRGWEATQGTVISEEGRRQCALNAGECVAPEGI